MIDLSILNYSIFSNPVYKYVLSFIILCSFFIVNKITKIILEKYLIKLAEKTKFNFDDILFRSLNPPINMFIFNGLFYLSYSILILPISLRLVLDKIFNILMIIPIVYFLIKFSTEFIGFYIKGRSKKVDDAAVDLLIQILRVIIVIIGALLMLDNLGYNISTLVAGLGVGGLAFALAAQDLLKNFFAGLAMIFDSTFKKGDRIQFNNTIGFVQELKLRTTKLKTLDGTLLTVPNSILSDNVLENIQKAPLYKVSFTIGVTYDTSSKKLKEAKETIIKAIEQNENSDTHWVYFDSFGDSSLNITVIYYLKLKYSDWPKTVFEKENINFEIKEQLEKIGVEFAFPTQTIELKKGDSGQKIGDKR